MPIAEHGFHLASKGDFHDFLLLHFGWPLPKLPEMCPCGSAYSVDHGQICKLGGFIHRRHDDVVDLLGRRMKQCYNDVEVEPLLQKLTGEQLTKYKTANRGEGAKSDLRVRDFWTDAKSAFFDVRVFYPHAASHQSKSIKALCKSIALTKKREYEERIVQVEHGNFTPLIFPSSGGMGDEATVVLKKLASEIAFKRKETYSSVMGVLRIELAFSLARSAIRCVRGSRSLRLCKSIVTKELAPVDLIIAEALKD